MTNKLIINAEKVFCYLTEVAAWIGVTDFFVCFAISTKMLLWETLFVNLSLDMQVIRCSITFYGIRPWNCVITFFSVIFSFNYLLRLQRKIVVLCKGATNIMQKIL